MAGVTAKSYNFWPFQLILATFVMKFSSYEIHENYRRNH